MSVESYVDSRERFDRLLRLVEERDDDALRAILAELHPSDIADVVEALEEEGRIYVLDLLPAELASETLAEMEREERPEDLLVAFEPERIEEILTELADDDAVELLRDLPPEDQHRILSVLPRLEAGELRQLLQYPEESAGGIMTTELIAVSVHLDAASAIEEVRRQARDLADEFYTVFVVDLMHRLIGTVSLQDLVLADPKQPLTELVQPPVATVSVDLDQEEVGRIIARYNIPSVPVVGPDNLLLGRVTWDDVIDVLEAEQTEDILRLGGVDAEEELRGSWVDAVKSRLPWLFANLITAAVAASVVSIYLDTIEAIAVLAVIMPVIAGMGGNAGTQALTVTVRRLALSDHSDVRRWGVVGKEIIVGLFNGAALGATVSGASVLLGMLFPETWTSEPRLGLVVLLAMWGNMIVASFAGAFVPILLERLGVDPAVASSIFVTTLTDLAGFFLLLGLASALLL